MDIDWEAQALEIEKQNEEARASAISRKSALSIGDEKPAKAQEAGKGNNDEEKQGLLTSDEGNINDNLYKWAKHLVYVSVVC